MKIRSSHMTRLALVALLPITIAQSAFAWPPTYGAEFEFTNSTLQDAPEFVNAKASESLEKKAQMQFVEKMRERCAELNCTVTEGPGKWDKDYTVRLQDGWWFKISYDPACVEITFKGTPLEELEQRKQTINQLIFETGTLAGFVTLKNDANHFNMGVRSAFDDSGKEFLKFFVDYANHPDLTLGSLGHDINNAPPLSVLGDEQREALQKIVDEVNSGRMTTIQEIAAAIQSRVYTKSYNAEWGAPWHYQAVGLKHINKTDLRVKDAPLELRAVWSQNSAEQFNLVSKLIEARVRFLKTQTGPIVYHASIRKSYRPFELKTRFYVYAEEAGLKYSDVTALLPIGVRRAALAAFLNPDERMSDRLDSAEQYWDLVVSSPWMRTYVAQLLSSPESRGLKEADDMIKRIHLEASKIVAPAIEAPAPFVDARPSTLGRILGFFGGGTRATPTAAVIPVPLKTVNPYEVMLKQIERSAVRGETCRALFN